MYKSEPTYTTKAGTKISPIVPAQYRGTDKARYRLVQILPPEASGASKLGRRLGLPIVPQRLEWVHVYNILVHEDGRTRPFEQPADVTLPAQVT